MSYLADDDLGILDLWVRSLELGHVVEQVRLQGRDGLVDVDVRALQVMVHVDKIKGAAGAGAEEGIQVGKTRSAATVGHRRGRELDLARKGLHVGLVDGGGVGGFEVGLAGVVGFVGGEEFGGAAGFDEGGDGGKPVGGVEGGVDAEGGDEGEGGVEGDAADAAGVSPVGAEGYVVAAFEEVAVGGFGVVVVDEAAFGGGAVAGDWSRQGAAYRGRGGRGWSNA